jgi:hypothetical protein
VTPEVSATGIPVEWLFGIIAALIGATYLNIMFEVRKLRKESEYRGRQMAQVKMYLRMIGKKLDLPYLGDPENTDNG